MKTRAAKVYELTKKGHNFFDAGITEVELNFVLRFRISGELVPTQTYSHDRQINFGNYVDIAMAIDRAMTEIEEQCAEVLKTKVGYSKNEIQNVMLLSEWAMTDATITSEDIVAEDPILSISELQKYIGEINIANGWRQDPTTDNPALQAKIDIAEIALAISELAEAIEEIRDGHTSTEEYFSGGQHVNKNFDLDPSDRLDDFGNLRKPEGVPAELSDALIRILDYADKRNIDLQRVTLQKLEYNKSRGFRHGGKIA